MLHDMINYIVDTVGALGYMGIFFHDVLGEFFFPFSQ